MTTERINELIAWSENHAKVCKYAEQIVGTKKEMDAAREDMYKIEDTLSPSEWLETYAVIEKMQRSLMMKIKHFFVLVYGKEDNIVRDNLKGKDYFDHWLAFKDLAHGCYANCR